MPVLSPLRVRVNFGGTRAFRLKFPPRIRLMRVSVSIPSNERQRGESPHGMHSQLGLGGYAVGVMVMHSQLGLGGLAEDLGHRSVHRGRVLSK